MKSIPVLLIAASVTLFTAFQTTAHASAEDVRVKEYLSGLLNDDEFRSLAGEQAVITVIRKGSTVTEATVSAGGETTLARELHRRIDWKRFPGSDRQRERFVVTLNEGGKFSVTIP
ncbi:MAG: hypothetical protein Fur0034_13820 [Desulfuromonadia bacterium]